jgi:hypothetical protein
MIDSSAGSAAQDRPIPDPRAERPLTAQSALRDADRAARQARRLLEASRGILSGNIALISCLPATLMAWWQAGGDRNRLLGALVMIGSAAWVAVSLRWMVRLRSSGGVRVVDRVEANLDAIGKHPFRRLAPAYALTFGAFLAWSYLFEVLPYSGVVIAMWSVTGVLTGFFIARFVLYRFWEDLLFAASVASAWALYLLPVGRLAPLAIVPPQAIIVGTICLHRRWRAWVRSLPAPGDAEAASGACP